MILGAFDPHQFSRVGVACGTDRFEDVEATRALRVAEIDVCRRKLEMIRASQVANEAIKARYHATCLRREAERQREFARGVPIIMPGVGPLRRLP